MYNIRCRIIWQLLARLQWWCGSSPSGLHLSCKNDVFKVTAGNKFQAVIAFLRNQLGLKQGDPLVSGHPRHRRSARKLIFPIQFTYINAASVL